MTQPSRPKRIAVIGSGISGLATHFHLEREAAARGIAIEVESWESRSWVGGNLRTNSRDGYMFESGPESILSNSPETETLLDELGLRAEVLPAAPAAKRRYLVHGGRLVAAPSGPVSALFGAFPDPLTKLSILLEPFRPSGPPDESVADFMRRRLGRRAYERLVDPIVTGIYAGDPEKLSVLSAFPKLKRLEQEHGSLLKGMLRGAFEASPRKGGAPAGKRPAARSTSFREGMGRLVRALVERLHGPIHLERGLDEMVRRGDRWILRGMSLLSGLPVEEEFDRVVMALPTYQAAEIRGDLPVEVLRLFAAIPYSPIAVVMLGLHRDHVRHALDGFGFLCPRSEERKILGTLFTSTLWPGRTPEGKVLLRVLVGGSRQSHLTELLNDRLLELVHGELEDLLGVKGRATFHNISRYARGIPEYPVGHTLTVERVHALLAGTGVWAAGSAWDGIGINECIRASRPRACEILDSLRGD